MVNVNTKSVRRNGLKGAVLLMVLAVMCVLLIMLTGAMAIVTTASNRANTQFEEHQALLTARDVLDATVNVLMQDTGIIDKQVNSDGTLNAAQANDGDRNKNSVANKTTPTDKKISQGRALEDAIFGRLCKDATGVYYDCSKSLSAWNGEDKYIEAYIGPGGVLTTKEVNAKEADKKNSYMIFDVKDVSSYTSGMSGMLADKGDGSIQVKFQLMSLVYDDGTQSGQYRQNVSTGKTNYLDNGDPSYDYILGFELKVVCSVTYDGVTSTTATILSQVPKKVEDRDAVTAPGAIDMTTGSNIFGGVTAGGEVKWTNNGDIYDNVFIMENLDVNAQKNFYLGPDNSIVVLGDMIVQNNMNIYGIDITDATERSHGFVFVRNTLKPTGGKLIIGQKQTSSADKYKNIDLICGGLEVRPDFQIFGNTYVDGPLVFNTGSLPSGSDCMFNGDLFVSDVDSGSKFGFEGNNMMADPADPTKQIVNTGWFNGKIIEAILKDVSSSAGSHFVSGNIYFYYSEYDLNGDGWINYSNINSEFDGCMPLGLIYKLLTDALNQINNGATMVTYGNAQFTSAQKNNITAFLAKMHPIGYDKGVTGATSPNASIFKYGPSGVGGVSEGMYSNWDLRVANMKNLIALPTDVEDGKFLFSDDIEIDSSFSKAVIKPADGETPKLDINIVMPKSHTQLITERSAKDTSSDKNAYGDLYCYKLPTALGKFYIYTATKNPELNYGKTNPNIDDYDFLALGADGISRNTEVDFKCVQLFDSTGHAAMSMASQTWDKYVVNIAHAMDNNISSLSINTTDAVPVDYLDALYEIMNGIYKTTGLSPAVTPSDNHSILGQYDITKAEPDQYSSFTAATAKPKFNVSFWTPVEKASDDCQIAFPVGATSVSTATTSPVSLTDAAGNTVAISSAFNSEGGVWYADTSTGNVLSLPTGHYKGTLVVKSGQDLAILLSSGSYNFEKLNIVTEDFYNIWKGADRFHAGDTGNDTTTVSMLTNHPTLSAPNIKWFMDDGCDITCMNGTMLMGYTYGPYARFRVTTTINGHNSFIYHINNSIHKTYAPQKIDFIGSLFIGNAQLCNDYSILYVSGKAASGDELAKRDPMLKTPHRYGNAGMDIVIPD